MPKKSITPFPCLPELSLTYWPNFLPAQVADAYLHTLTDTIQWTQESYQLFGRAVLAPRLVAWYGDAQAVYRYSGVEHQPKKWIAPLSALQREIEQRVNTRFNAVLANLYRDGRDSMGWHADAEPALGPAPVIASISLGAVRTLRFRHQTQKLALGFPLAHGSLLLMDAMTQQCWQHSLPKSKKHNKPRLNLTFRRIISHP